MAAVLRSQTVSTQTVSTPSTPADRRQWWEGVQAGVSALLTEAAHPATPAHRAAG